MAQWCYTLRDTNIAIEIAEWSSWELLWRCSYIREKRGRLGEWEKKGIVVHSPWLMLVC